MFLILALSTSILNTGNDVSAFEICLEDSWDSHTVYVCSTDKHHADELIILEFECVHCLKMHDQAEIHLFIYFFETKSFFSFIRH